MFHIKNILNRMMSLSLVASIGFAVLLYGASPASAQTLGATQTFGALGGTQVTAGGAGATINGDVGVSPGTSITGPITVVPPYGVHNNDSSAIAARAAYLTLYASLLTGSCTALPSDQLNGQNLGPGCHSGGALDLASTGTLILTGSGVYIFRAASSLTTGVNSNVVLGVGVDPCNVFWQVTSLAILNGNTFPGTVAAQAGVHLGTGANLTGRALSAAGGDVTMAGGNIVGGCAALAPPPPTPPPTPPPGCPPITLAPPTLPVGRVGVAYSQQITATGGTGPYVFTVLSGTLPAGLTLSSGGLLSGTPTTLGSSPVTIQGTDSNGCPGVITYTIVIAAATCPLITLAPPTLPAGTVGVAYSQQITASGGTGPYVFTVLSGTLPVGLTLSSGGLLSGTPTTLGSSPVVIEATDGNGCPGVIAYTIVIGAAFAGIPTLSGWGLMTLMVLIAFASIYRLRRI
jgi:Ice-binding-like/Putative Ig domain/IPTL-CTERM motif